MLIINYNVKSNRPVDSYLCALSRSTLLHPPLHFSQQKAHPNRLQISYLATSTTLIENRTTQTYNIPYQYDTPASPQLGFAVFDSQTYILNNAIDVCLSVDTITQSSLKLTVTSNSPTRIQLLIIRYYVAQPEYGSVPTFSSYSGASSINRDITTTTPYIYTFTGLSNVVSMAGGVITFYSFTGLNISSLVGNSLDICLSVSQLNATSVSVTVSVSSTKTHVI